MREREMRDGNVDERETEIGDRQTAGQDFSFISPFLPVNKSMKEGSECNAIISKLICFEPAGKKPFTFHG